MYLIYLKYRIPSLNIFEILTERTKLNAVVDEQKHVYVPIYNYQ